MRRKFFTLIFAFAVSFNCAYAMFNNDKPLVVTITSDSCTYCKQLDPVIKDLKEEYDGQVDFITLTVSSKSSLLEAWQVAEENGVGNFFEHNKSNFPTVGIICPGKDTAEKVFVGETRKEIYEKELNEFLTNSSKICSL